LDLSVVILNWNTCALLEKCLRSLVCPHRGIDVEIIVVDNASGDNSREMVRREFPQVNLIVNPKNVGFGAGNNVAVPQASGRYVLFLNSDTVVMDGALSAMVSYADANSDIGILGPKLLNGDGSLQYSCRRYPNLATGFFRNTPLGRLFPKNRFAADYLLQDWDHATPRDVDWVSGAALMMRCELLDKIGAFDEDYYMYCEDVDLCWRANHTPLADATDEHTWRVTYYPDAIIYHLIGKSSDQAPTRMTYEFHRSQYLFYRKHYAASTPLLVRPLIPIGIALRAVGTMSRYRIRYWQRRIMGREKPRKR
jgi:GT2 family glycosyltransferase